MDVRRTHTVAGCAFLLVAVMGVLAATGVTPTVGGTSLDHDDSVPPSDQLIEPSDAAGELWLYTSKTRSTSGRVLALNLVVMGENSTVRTALVDRADRNWTTVDGHRSVRVEPNASPWRDARGGVRYTYVRPPRSGPGEWVDASYQLGTGTYLGGRVHLRAYPSPTGNWTAFQAHREYWDWYRLGHTVTGTTVAAATVESDLGTEPFVGNVTVHDHGVDRGGSDGWLLVVELAAVAVVAGSVVDRRRSELADLASNTRLVLAVAGIVVGVRVVGIASDVVLPSISQVPFVAVLYPALVAGPPIAVVAYGRDRPVFETTVAATGGLALGIVVDAVLLGITRVPWVLLQHRLALVAAFATLAAGIAARDRTVTIVGVLAWLVVIGAPLFGFL